MKAKKLKFLIFAILTFSFFPSSIAQDPPGFNYQAIARENSELLFDTDLDIRVQLLQGGDSGELVWEEVHSVMTSPYGLFSLMVGSGASSGGGSADTFGSIDWSNGDIHIKVSLKKTGANDYIVYPAELLGAVPYALHSLSASPSSLKIQGTGSASGEPLFMVTRKDGYPVFAVYEDGVYAYTDTVSSGKGVKGGFAVGGYNASSKGAADEYMRITADSIRFYINDDNSKGLKGGFAVGGIKSSKAGDADILKVTSDSTRINVGSGDGGFSVGNIGAGDNTSFMKLTPENYFIGHESGESMTTGIFNSFIGYQSGKNTTTGNNNAFLGYQSGIANTTGWDNLFLGPTSGFRNTTGYGNVYMGKSAGYNNTEGVWNVFIGQAAGAESKSEFNVFVGAWSGNKARSASNVFVGGNSGPNVTTGGFNTFIGAASGTTDSTGAYNTIIGAESARDFNGYSNVFIGTWAGDQAGAANDNVYIGLSAAGQNSDSYGNVAVGSNVNSNGQGSRNVYLGVGAANNTEGDGNVFIGANTGENSNGSNMMMIDNSGTSNPLVYGDFSANDVVINGSLNYGSASGTNFYTTTVKSIGFLEEGMSFYIKFQNANTTISTININGLGDVLITRSDGSILFPGDINTGGIHLIIYDGTKFQLMSY